MNYLDYEYQTIIVYKIYNLNTKCGQHSKASLKPIVQNFQRFIPSKSSDLFNGVLAIEVLEFSMAQEIKKCASRRMFQLGDVPVGGYDTWGMIQFGDVPVGGIGWKILINPWTYDFSQIL